MERGLSVALVPDIARSRAGSREQRVPQLATSACRSPPCLAAAHSLVGEVWQHCSAADRLPGAAAIQRHAAEPVWYFDAAADHELKQRDHRLARRGVQRQRHGLGDGPREEATATAGLGRRASLKGCRQSPGPFPAPATLLQIAPQLLAHRSRRNQVQAEAPGSSTATAARVLTAWLEVAR